jgi:hypothetical protein
MHAAETAGVGGRARRSHSRGSKDTHQQHGQQRSGSQAVLQITPPVRLSIGQRTRGNQGGGFESGKSKEWPRIFTDLRGTYYVNGSVIPAAHNVRHSLLG